MKTYTREELEKLATENPQELALLFAQKVEGITNATSVAGYHWITYKTIKGTAIYCPDYLTDWTAVINAGKKAGIECVVSPTKFAWASTLPSDDKKKGFHCDQQPNWPDCAALMIVMIGVMQGEYIK